MKNFVRGMGVGILVTTLVFAIAFMLKGNDISDDEIRQRAKALGMVEEDTQVVKPKEESTGQAVESGNPIENAAQTDMAVSMEAMNIVTDTDAPIADVVLEQQDMELTTPIPDQTPVIQELSGNAVKVQIGKGQDGITISNLLQQSGVIADAEDFNRYLSDNRLQMNILYGEFILEKNMSYEAIVEKIIAK